MTRSGFINASTGQLTFEEAPEYDNPWDADGDEPPVLWKLLPGADGLYETQTCALTFSKPNAVDHPTTVRW